MDRDSLTRLVTAALDRIRLVLHRHTPRVADQVLTWMNGFWSGPRFEDYWTHPEAFPLLLAPWWLEEKLTGSANPPLQRELIYSSMTGYCYIRLIDNVMDKDVPADRKLLPMLGFFHREFENVYRGLFSYEHPFWDSFTSLWYRSAELTTLDGSMREFNASEFSDIAAQKLCAAKIPLTAVAQKYSRTDLLPAWWHFLDRFSCWNQMLNDTFDCLRDSLHQRGTFFLSEAARRRIEGESLLGWLLREGLEWGMETLQEKMNELRVRAPELDCPDLLYYLNQRADILSQRRIVLQEGLRNLARLRSALEPFSWSSNRGG